jgi:transglutaminase-like putative cysteine protease
VSTTRSSLYAAAALAAVTVAAALGLGRVFDDGGFALPIIGAAVLPHVVGAVARNWRWPGWVIVVVTAGVLLLYAAFVIAPESTAYGFPWVGTFNTLGNHLGDGWDVFRTGRAPVPVTDGVLLLCIVLTATVAGFADWLAFRAEATLAAIVPSLLLFVFASTLGTDDLRTVTTLAYAITALVFLMLQHQALLEAHRSWFSGRRLGSSAPLVSAAAFVGGLALLSGLVIAPALPGADDGPLIDYRTFGGSRQGGTPGNFNTLSPLVNLRGQLTEAPDVVVFRVRAPLRLYWRIAALDEFDGEVWGIESEARDVGDELERERPPDTVRQFFSLNGLSDRWLPAAYEPLATDLEDARVVPESGTLVAPEGETTGLDYRVDSRVVTTDPTPEQIEATNRAAPASLASSTELPDDFPEEVEELARDIVAGAQTRYEQAKLLEQYFLSGEFTYDLDGPVDGSGNSAIEDFLESKRGFCEQFAGAYAAMARAIGLPTRVAVGFAPGEYDGDEFQVMARDAHAWPEVWLAGLGWTQFEPTPAGPQPGMADATAGQPVSRTTPRPTTATSTPASSTPAGSSQNASNIPRGESTVQAGSGSSDDDGFSLPGWFALAVVGGVAVVAALVWFVWRIARKVRRRTRRRRRVAPGHSVAGAWQDALERLADAGMPASESLTPHEQVGGYTGRGAPTGATEPLADLAELYARAHWSSREPTDDDVTRAWSDADAVRDALSETATTSERVRRALKV